MMRKLLVLLAVAAASSASADEGMWTYEDFPAAAVRRDYGVPITPAWLEQVRLSTVRLANCSGVFVSRDGLILTNHHCIEPCLEALSGAKVSYVQDGLAAVERRREKRCASQLADVLIATENVTADVVRAGQGLPDAEANAARKGALSSLEQRCEQEAEKSTSGALKCQGVTLYQGAEYHLYKYKRYQDVRMVFAPQEDIAAFGGDPDNFHFPRWSLDFAVLRAYEGGQPARTPHFLKIRFEGPEEHEAVFVAGNPASTSRLDTLAQLRFDRDVAIPNYLLRSAELRGRLIQFGERDPADADVAQASLDILENSIKVHRLMLDALHDESLIAFKTRQEDALRAGADLAAGDPWRDIERATGIERQIYLPYTFLEAGVGFNCGLFRYARAIVRGAAERLKPNEDRLREYTDTALPRLEQQLFTPEPVYADIEVLTLSFSLERMREWLGADDPVVKRLLEHDSPQSLARRLVSETRLTDPAVRRRLWDGGEAAVEASQDPMIRLAREVEADSRAVRTRYENQVEAPVSAAERRISQVRLRLYGKKAYPDATFTPRLSYGSVQGWIENGTRIGAFTELGGLYGRATGAAPFRLPEGWIRLRDRLDMRTPFCIATNNDIVGGNSGSPLIDAKGRIVGLMFDGNRHSIAGAFWFDPANNRAVALHPAIMREALDKVYGMHELLQELGEK